MRLWLAAVIAALIGYGVKGFLPLLHVQHYASLLNGAIVLPLYGVLYLIFCRALGVVAPSSLQRLFRRR
jgi:putative peptidoglycan lipid II flippase